MRIWIFVLFVVSTRTTEADDLKGRIKQKRSVENLLSQFSFNPFTPFPELLTTTLPGLKTGKEKRLREKKFEVFVAVEQKTTTTTSSATRTSTTKITNNFDQAPTNDLETIFSRKHKAWITKILNRNPRRKTTPPARMMSEDKLIREWQQENWMLATYIKTDLKR